MAVSSVRGDAQENDAERRGGHSHAGACGTSDGDRLKPSAARSLVNEAGAISVGTATRRQRRAEYRCAGSLVNQAGSATLILQTVDGRVVCSRRRSRRRRIASRRAFPRGSVRNERRSGAEARSSEKACERGSGDFRWDGNPASTPGRVPLRGKPGEPGWVGDADSPDC
jgi:hypothetical protein